MRVEIGRCLLYDLIHAKGMTPQQFADKIGMLKSQLSMYATGERKMSLKNAKMFAVALGCSIDDLYEWKIR